MADGSESRAPVEEEQKGPPPTVAERLALYQRAGGVVTPLLTALFAFVMAGIVVLSTGHNPWRTYKAIFEGAGLNWFFHLGNYSIHVPLTHTHMWFWWDTNTNHTATYNLTQTLLTATPLILTGLAVAFAFRCGLFNIGGQGQYVVGAIAAVYIGSRFTEMAHLPHVMFAIVAAALAGAVWGGIAGVLKATVGAHEVITTIMLNWIAYWGGSYLFARGGPLQNQSDQSLQSSDPIANGAKLPVIWGTEALQGLHAGVFLALAGLIVFYVVFSRTTLGYEIRTVGFNPEAARYGGIRVSRSFVVAMAISGLFAGLAGAVDLLGWQYRLGVTDVQISNIGFIGIAVALLGRNTALGVGFAAVLFGALMTGTSTRSLDPTVFPPELAGNLALMIQALVLLFIGADLIILYVWQARRRLPPLLRVAGASKERA